MSVVKSDENGVKEAVNRAIDLANGLEDLKGKKNIAIKPNLCTPKSSSSGSTTDPQILDALIERINTIKPDRINIVETNNSKATADETFEYLGYNVLARKYQNVHCMNLSKDRRYRVHINGKIFSSIMVPECMIFSDYFISIAKLKTHADYRFSGVLKNQFGLLLGPRAQYHGFMSKVITDLSKFYKPDLCIIDGVTGMEGFGPVNGTPKRVNVIIASKDPVAADAVAAQIVGIKPSKIGYLKYAEKNGIGTSKGIETVGCDIKEIVTPFDFIPTKCYYLSKISLAMQRYSMYIRNFAEFISLARSALATIGFSALEQRLSYSGLFHLATETILKLED